MKKSKFYFLPMLFLLVFSLSFVFSSKDPNPPTNPFNCSNASIEDTQIQINFSPTASGNSGMNLFREHSYQGYIPQIDLRFGPNISTSAAGSLLSNTKYYCVVTVTSPQCSNFEWIAVMDETNATSNGLMDIKVLGDGADTFLKVEYFEVLSGAGSAPQFNKINNTRLKYAFDFEYFGGLVTNLPEPISLNPISLVNQDGDFQGGGYGKQLGFGDYGSINNYIEINNINPE
jgi:hypothetical protein